MRREDERGFPSSLLRGDYNEVESASSFQEAVRQWRGQTSDGAGEPIREEAMWIPDRPGKLPRRLQAHMWMHIHTSGFMSSPASIVSLSLNENSEEKSVFLDFHISFSGYFLLPPSHLSSTFSVQTHHFRFLLRHWTVQLYHFSLAHTHTWTLCFGWYRVPIPYQCILKSKNFWNIN